MHITEDQIFNSDIAYNGLARLTVAFALSNAARGCHQGLYDKTVLEEDTFVVADTSKCGERVYTVDTECLSSYEGSIGNIGYTEKINVKSL